MEDMDKIKLLAVVGPTASGKTKLSAALAKLLQGEIINADSMQIYEDMNIATAKPTLQERAGIPHHLMGFLPKERAYSVSDYVQDARAAIKQVHANGKQPILVGGTGQYYSAMVDNLQFSEVAVDHTLRDELYAQAKVDQGQALYQQLLVIDPIAAKEIHPHNYVRLVRAIELYRTTGKTLTQTKIESRLQESPYDAVAIGLTFRDRQKLYDRIDLRVDLMMQDGLLQEAQTILQSTDLTTAMNAIGYKELKPYFEGHASLDCCIDRIKQESRRYAKRQLTWFRRDERIAWIYLDETESFDEVLDSAKKILVNHDSLCYNIG